MESQNKKRKLIKSAENLFRPFTHVCWWNARTQRCDTYAATINIAISKLSVALGKNVPGQWNREQCEIGWAKWNTKKHYFLPVFCLRICFCAAKRKPIHLSHSPILHTLSLSHSSGFRYLVTSFIWLNAFVSLLGEIFFSAIFARAKMRCRHERASVC